MLEKSKDPYWEMGYQNGLSIGRTLPERNRKYIRGVNKPGHMAYKEGNPNEGVSVMMDSFRKGATVEEIAHKLVRQRNKSWSDNKSAASKYVNDRVIELESKTYFYWYGWLLTKEGDKYFIKEVSPAELCYAKFGDQSQVDNIPQESKGVTV